MIAVLLIVAGKSPTQIPHGNNQREIDRLKNLGYKQPCQREADHKGEDTGSLQGESVRNSRDRHRHFRATMTRHTFWHSAAALRFPRAKLKYIPVKNPTSKIKVMSPKTKQRFVRRAPTR
jgi:hypothetical protein